MDVTRSGRGRDTSRAGARDEEIVEVLSTVAEVVGSARVVAAAPRLARAIGYDIEVEGWGRRLSARAGGG